MREIRHILLVLAAIAALAACRKDPIPDPDPEPDPDPIEVNLPYYLYGVAEISINTDGAKPVTSKDPSGYFPCDITVTGSLTDKEGASYDVSYDGRGKIRGRGNSTWEWYNKKPYRIKLDESSRFMGMKKNRDWVLMADYRDVTHLMNNVGFTMAHYLGIPYTNHSRYAHVTLNGKYLGLYMVTEQVEEGNHRVDIAGDGGYLIGLDVNDGPGDCPRATDNFYSSVYYTACCVKYPEDPTSDQLAAAKSEFAKLEKAIKSQNWETITSLLDIESMINYLIIEEAICNVEMNNGNSIRSGYINKKPDGLWTMGPVWDCDGGFSYNWGDMYDYSGRGHTYFETYRNLIYGTDPYNESGAYGSFPRFFADLWGIDEFVAAYKAQWKEKSEGMLEAVLENIDAVYEVTGSAMVKDAKLWGIADNYTTSSEVKKLKTWLTNRFNYLDNVIANYPGGGETPAEEVKIVDSFEIDASYTVRSGHYTGTTLDLTAAQLTKIGNALGIDGSSLYSNEFVSLVAVSGETFVENSTASDTFGYGFWFDKDGNVTTHGTNSYIYAEFSYTANQFKLGYHPDICEAGTYNPAVAFVYKSKAIKITFNITTQKE